MSITLDTLHGIEYGFRQIKVRFFTNLEFKQCWHGIKNAEKKTVLLRYPTHQIGQFPGQVLSSKMAAPGGVTVRPLNSVPKQPNISKIDLFYH